MSMHSALLLIAALLPADDKPKATDHDRIQGEWKISAEVQNGKETPPARNEKMRIRFTANKMIVTEGDEKHTGTYQLDPQHKPATISVTPEDGAKKGKKGIYQLSGDTLTICLTLEEGKDPPSDFTAKAGSGRVMLTLERIKP